MTKIRTARTNCWLTLTLIALTLTDTLNADNYYDFLENPIQGCAILGYPHATLNECGYCVGNGTGLDLDYGKDCLGNCGQKAVFDCKQVCNGNAYRDECSQECIEDVRENDNFRDCRGECIKPELSGGQAAYKPDECGYCRLQTSEPSPYIDCAKQCHRPGMIESKQVCGLCLGPHSNLTEFEVKDDCGNCLTSNQPCSCSRDPLKCGCNNPNQCYKILSSEPKIVEKGTESMVLLLGYFYPPLDRLFCYLQHQKRANIIITSPVSYFHGNRTAVSCIIEPPIEGQYSIGLGIENGRRDLIQAGESKVLAFDPAKARVTSMTPVEMLTTEFKNDIELLFDGPSVSLIPSLNLICKVQFSSKAETDETIEPDGRDKNEQTLIITGNKPYSCILPSKVSRKSSKLLITPTIDGDYPISHAFTFTLISPPPEVSHQNCFISSDGLTIVIMFTRSVDVSKEMSIPGPSLCAVVFSEDTLANLGKYHRITCVWSSKVQLVVYLQKPIQAESIEISLRRGIFREDSSSIALVNDQPIKLVVRKLTTEWWAYNPNLVITGPSEIPRCGLFALSGHYSSPKGSTGVKFKWSVTKGGVELNENDQLTLLTSLTESQNILLDTSFFDIGTSYEFTLQAIFESTDQKALKAAHRLVRFNYDAPIVSIYSSIMLPAVPFSVDNSAIFWAETYIPTCVHPFQRVGLSWRVIDPRVKFNFTLAHLYVHILSPYSLPDNHPVTFYLSAFLGHRINETSGAAFSLIAQKAPLKAVIEDGSPMIALGSHSGPVKISGLHSGDGSGQSVTYHWSCIDSDSHEPCFFNFAQPSDRVSSTETSLLLVNRTLQKSPVLRFDSRNLIPNRELVLSLQVFDRNETSRMSDVEVALVKVTSGDAPQIIMGSIYIWGKHRANIRSLHNLAIMVPAHTPLIIKAIVRGADKVAHIEWDSSNFIHPLNWKNKLNYKNEIHTELHVHSDHVFPFGFHAFKLRACSRNEMCSEATTQFTASQGVTQCQLNIQPYYEYELMTAFVEKCNIPPGYGPLIYQIYGVSPSGEVFPLTVPQFSTVFIFPGIPALDEEGGENTFALKFCDIFSYCEMLLSSPVQVNRNSNRTSLIKDLLKLAKRYNIGGEPHAALSVLGTLLKEKSLDRGVLNQAAKDATEYSLGILQRPSQLLSKGQISLSFHVISEIVAQSDDLEQNEKLLDLLSRLSEKSFGLQILPDLMTLRSTAYKIVQPLHKYEKDITKSLYKRQKNVLQSAREAFKILLQMAAAQIPLGRRVEFGSFREDGEDEKQDYAFKTLLIHDKTIDGAVITLDGVQARIRVGKSVKRRFSSPWKCSKGKDNCNSVVYAYTIFPLAAPYPNKTDSFRLTPVLSVDIFSPETGKIQKVQRDLNAVEMVFSVSANTYFGDSSYQIKCFTWNERRQSWNTDGIHLYRNSDNSISCWSGQMAAFAAFKVPGPFNVGGILLITFGVLLLTVVIGFLVILCSQPNQSSRQSTTRSLIVNSNRSSPSRRSLSLIN